MDSRWKMNHCGLTHRSISIILHKTQVQKDPDTLTLIVEKVQSSPECIDTGDNFLNRTPIVQALRQTNNKWDSMKLKCFCKAKGTIDRTKWQTTQ